VRADGARDASLDPLTRFVGLRISNIFEPADYAAIPSFSDNPEARQWNL